MRNHRLRERRLELGKSQYEIGLHADFNTISAQSWVSAVEAGKASPARVLAVRKAIVWFESEPRRRREAARREAARVARQRALWASLPPSPEVEALKAAMIERAIDLLNNGDGDGYDVLAEFLPEADIDAAVNRWLDSIEPASGPSPSQDDAA